jgi:glycosyltransferase involved in cell wall biosynthesis
LLKPDARDEAILMHAGKVVVVVPTLDEEAGIAKTLDGLRDSLKGFDYEIVVVDGHSRDRTVELSKSRNATVVYQKGAGYGDALFTGFLYGTSALKAKIFLTIDGDASYESEDAPALIDHIAEGKADLVVGRRQSEPGSMGLINRHGNRLISWMTRNLLHIPVSDSQSGMFAFRSVLIEETDFRTKGWAANTEILKQAAELGMMIHELPVRYNPRLGKSKLNPLKGGLANLGVALRIMRDAEPLLLFLSVASVFFGIGAAAGAAVAVGWTKTGIETGLGTALLSAVTIIIGVELVLFGLVADMLKHLRRKTLAPEQISFEVA